MEVPRVIAGGDGSDEHLDAVDGSDHVESIPVLLNCSRTRHAAAGVPAIADRPRPVPIADVLTCGIERWRAAADVGSARNERVQVQPHIGEFLGRGKSAGCRQAGHPPVGIELQEVFFVRVGVAAIQRGPALLRSNTHGDRRGIAAHCLADRDVVPAWPAILHVVVIRRAGVVRCRKHRGSFRHAWPGDKRLAIAGVLIGVDRAGDADGVQHRPGYPAGDSRPGLVVHPGRTHNVDERDFGVRFVEASQVGPHPGMRRRHPGDEPAQRRVQQRPPSHAFKHRPPQPVPRKPPRCTVGPCLPTPTAPAPGKCRWC